MYIDNWIIEYLNASIKECDQVLECINATILKIPTTICATKNNNKLSDNHQIILLAIFRHLLPYIKQIWSSKTIMAKIVPELVANLCCSIDYLTAEQNEYRFDELFKFFIETKGVNNGLVTKTTYHYNIIILILLFLLQNNY